MSRKISTNWAIGDKITAERLQELNQELDNLYANGDDIGRVTPALSWTALHVDIGGFPYSIHGNYWIYAWITDLAIADSSTKYIQINSSWVISQDNARDTDKGLIAVVVTAGGIITSITNYKSAFFGGYKGTGDLNWPSGSIDSNILVFDWLTGKLAKDSGKSISDLETEASNMVTHIMDNTYMTWEAISAWQCVFTESCPTFALATNKWNIGDVSWNTRVAFPAIGTGSASNALKLALCKTWSPTAYLRIRLETDNAWSPSGTLIDANATEDINPSTLTTSLVDTTVTLTGTITIPLWTKVHIVASAVGDVVNGSNYYCIGYSTNNTTTRWLNTYNGSVWNSLYLHIDTFDWTSIDSSYWNLSWVWNIVCNNQLSIWPNYYTQTGYLVSNSTIPYSNIFISAKLSAFASTGFSRATATSAIQIYKNASNYISADLLNTYWSFGTTTINLSIVEWWVTTYTYSEAIVSWTAVKILKSGTAITFKKWNGSSWVSIWWSGTFSATWLYARVSLDDNVWGSVPWQGDAQLDDFCVANTDYPSYFQSPSGLALFPYVSSTLFQDKLLSLTDADFTYKLPSIVRISTEAKSIWTYPKCTTNWFSSNVVWSYGNIAFVSNTPWELSSTPWTNNYWVWFFIADNKLCVNPFPVAGQNTTAVSLLTGRTLTTSYVKYKSARIQRAWQYTCLFSLNPQNSWWRTTYWRIYKNWVAYWTERIVAWNVWETYVTAEKLVFNVWDTVELWGKSSDTAGIIANFTLKYNMSDELTATDTLD